MVFCLYKERGAMYIPPTRIFLTTWFWDLGVSIIQTASIPSGASIPASSTMKLPSLYAIATPPPVTDSVKLPFLPLVGIPLTPLLHSITL